MAPTKQEIIRQIQQGKVKTALEGIVQLSGLARDKEVQQRCLILQSQLSQLDSNFGMGTFDQKTYQMEYNRITQATLELVYMLPAVVEAPPQYRAQGSAYQPQTTAGSGWKTWGILLTGGVGVLVILMVVGLMMNKGQDGSNTNIPGAPTGNTLTQQNQPSTAPMTSAKEVAPAPQEHPHAKFVASWSGSMIIAGIVLGGLKIKLMDNYRYKSNMADPTSGQQLASDSGTWSVSENGTLVLQSDQGANEEYSVLWNSATQFNATLVNATNQELIGLTVSFSKL
ncbi:MAG: hypothetical protein J0M29_06625 [Chitinophagales bacterium]|nr:hypothetical protein [Chitinophagales bacterium]